MRFWVYIPPHDALCPSNVPPKISLKTANLLMREGQYIRVQSIKKSPQTQSYQGFASLQGVVPVAGVEPARVISPTDFESASSTNSNTPARCSKYISFGRKIQVKILHSAHFESAAEKSKPPALPEVLVHINISLSGIWPAYSQHCYRAA